MYVSQMPVLVEEDVEIWQDIIIQKLPIPSSGSLAASTGLGCLPSSMVWKKCVLAQPTAHEMELLHCVQLDYDHGARCRLLPDVFCLHLELRGVQLAPGNEGPLVHFSVVCCEG